MSVPKPLKDKLWDAQFGIESGIGFCFVCDNTISSRRYEAGHIRSRKDGGGTYLENLKCICGTCNKSMGTQNLIEFKNTYFLNHKEKREEIIRKYCIVSDFLIDKIIKSDSEWLIFYDYYEELMKKKNYEHHKIHIYTNKCWCFYDKRIRYKFV